MQTYPAINLFYQNKSIRPERYNDGNDDRIIAKFIVHLLFLLKKETVITQHTF